jgi:hypothetical protein
MLKPKKDWCWRWRDRATGKEGEYFNTQTDHQTVEEVKAWAELYFPKLKFLGAEERGIPEGAKLVPVDPEHVMHGTKKQLKQDVKALIAGK